MKRKKQILTAVLASCLALGLMACGAQKESTTSTNATQTQQTQQAQQTTQTITITTYNANQQKQELEVPYNPQRIAVLDLAALDILDCLGMGDRVVGVAKGTSVDYLQSYITEETIANIGTIKEADLEATMACQPDIIFIGGRLATSYDALSEIAPVIYLKTDTELGVVESTAQNATTIASLFGMESEVTAWMSALESRIETLAQFAADQTAIIGMCTSGSFNVLGNDGRCSIIGKEIGFQNIGIDTNLDTATHGNEASFEFVVEKDPDYIFVMDRDAAIQTDGAKLAQEIMENQLIMRTSAYQNGNLIYLEHPTVWYTAEGGVTALDIMLSDLEDTLLQ